MTSPLDLLNSLMALLPQQQANTAPSQDEAAGGFSSLLDAVMTEEAQTTEASDVPAEVLLAQTSTTIATQTPPQPLPDVHPGTEGAPSPEAGTVSLNGTDAVDLPTEDAPPAEAETTTRPALAAQPIIRLTVSAPQSDDPATTSEVAAESEVAAPAAASQETLKASATTSSEETQETPQAEGKEKKPSSRTEKAAGKETEKATHTQENRSERADAAHAAAQERKAESTVSEKQDGAAQQPETLPTPAGKPPLHAMAETAARVVFQMQQQAPATPSVPGAEEGKNKPSAPQGLSDITSQADLPRGLSQAIQHAAPQALQNSRALQFAQSLPLTTSPAPLANEIATELPQVAPALQSEVTADIPTTPEIPAIAPESLADLPQTQQAPTLATPALGGLAAQVNTQIPAAQTFSLPAQAATLSEDVEMETVEVVSNSGEATPSTPPESPESAFSMPEASTPQAGLAPMHVTGSAAPTQDVTPEAEIPVFRPQGEGVTEQVVEGTQFSLKAGHRELTLKLNPHNLGEVRVNLATDAQQQVHARFIATSPETREILQQELQTLKTSLEAQGVQVGRLTVVIAGEGASNTQDRSQQQQHHSQSQQQQTSQQMAGDARQQPQQQQQAFQQFAQSQRTSHYASGPRPRGGPEPLPSTPAAEPPARSHDGRVSILA